MNKEEQELLDYLREHCPHAAAFLSTPEKIRLKQLIHAVKQSGMREAAKLLIKAKNKDKRDSYPERDFTSRLALKIITEHYNAILAEANKPL